MAEHELIFSSSRVESDFICVTQNHKSQLASGGCTICAPRDTSCLQTLIREKSNPPKKTLFIRKNMKETSENGTIGELLPRDRQTSNSCCVCWKEQQNNSSEKWQTWQKHIDYVVCVGGEGRKRLGERDLSHMTSSPPWRPWRITLNTNTKPSTAVAQTGDRQPIEGEKERVKKIERLDSIHRFNAKLSDAEAAVAISVDVWSSSSSSTGLKSSH